MEIFNKALQFIIALPERIYSHLDEVTHNAGRQIITFGIIMGINFPVYFFIWLYESEGNQEDVALRIIATLICLTLAFKNFWPEKLKSILPVYWYFAITFTLPFFFVFMTLQNHGSTEWLMNLMSAVFFVFLLLDFAGAIFTLIIGTLVAWVAFSMTGVELYYDPGIVTPLGLSSTFFAVVIIGGFFSRNRDFIENEKVQTIKLLATSMAHELRTPLASMSLVIQNSRKNIVALVEDYEKLTENHPEKLFTEKQLSYLKNAPAAIEREIKYATGTINILLSTAKRPQIEKNKLMLLSINDSIESAIDRYPYRGPSQINLIHWNKGEDFFFLGQETLIMQVLFNLMKNSLQFIHEEQKGEITIWTEIGEKDNQLHFLDTAKGIPAKLLPHIYKPFYSRREGGTGVGLAFCKMVMENFGGKISCISKEGEFTEFILSFPKFNAD